MSELKFKFSIQPYQTRAVESILEIFTGQPNSNYFSYKQEHSFIRSLYDQHSFDDEFYMGFKNADLILSEEELLENIQRIQSKNNLEISDTLKRDEMGSCNLDIEMETGSGKTYVYIKTIFELNKQFGWSKFIVVVPSIAIREGVRKNFEISTDHFMEFYGKKARFFVYDSSNLGQLKNFESSPDINVMIINTQAFNSRRKQDRRIFQELDDFESRRPIDIIKVSHPILILDEPQKMGGKVTKETLKEFNPLFTLNFSATHKDHHNLIYVLDALDAYNQKLVKRIKVKGLEIKNLPGTDSYIYLDKILLSPSKPPRARIEFEINYKSGIKRDSRILKVGDNLFLLSKEMEQYRGYSISDIDPLSNTITFSNGVILSSGQVLGDISEKDVRRIQIRETIRSHFEKERELFDRKIKVLSLFFIDEVAKYRRYDEEGNELNSDYGQMFEEEYSLILEEFLTKYGDTPYGKYLKEIKAFETHAGYFSIDKKGRKVDSKIKRGSDTSDDISAYELILKDKERLLSFENPVRFIFSHSALREGWDNPNVFQICALKHEGTSPTQKRQEVGRGLRLCVDQEGNRMDITVLGDQVHEINELTVIASDGFQDFVAELQQGIQEDLYDRPEKISVNYFYGKTIISNGREISISKEQAQDIYSYLRDNRYIDKNDLITKNYQIDTDNRMLASLPDSCNQLSEGIHSLIQGIYDPKKFEEMISNARKVEITENPLNDNFYRSEFKKLWNFINHQYTYTVNFDSNELIEKSVASINNNLHITKLKYRLTEGIQLNEINTNMIREGNSFKENKTSTKFLNRHERSQIKYDLIGKIASGAILTRKTATAILTRIKPEVFNMFKENPEEFISKATSLINEQKATMIVEDITYNQTDKTYDSSIFTANAKGDLQKAYRSQKNVQDYVFTDGLAEKNIERKFAEDMDKAEEVSVYAKLPKGFSIPTPVGNYTPDWAIAFRKESVKHIFFIAETKGSLDSLQLRKIEDAKIQCAKKLYNEISTDDIVFHEVKDYEGLLNIMETL